MVLLEDTGLTVSVTPFTTEYNALRGVPIASAATAYDCPTSGETHLLIFNECLFLGERLPVSLLCPNQMRAFGLSIRDTPQQLDADLSHDVSFPDNKLRIPLEMEGVVSYFTTRKPTDDELARCARLQMTSDMSWDPRSTHFGQTEQQLRQQPDHEVSMITTTMQLFGDRNEGKPTQRDEFDGAESDLSGRECRRRSSGRAPGRDGECLRRRCKGGMGSV